MHPYTNLIVFQWKKESGPCVESRESRDYTRDSSREPQDPFKIKHLHAGGAVPLKSPEVGASLLPPPQSSSQTKPSADPLDAPGAVRNRLVGFGCRPMTTEESMKIVFSRNLLVTLPPDKLAATQQRPQSATKSG